MVVALLRLLDHPLLEQLLNVMVRLSVAILGRLRLWVWGLDWGVLVVWLIGLLLFGVLGGLFLGTEVVLVVLVLEGIGDGLAWLLLLEGHGVVVQLH
jgi:hypothetical protein